MSTNVLESQPLYNPGQTVKLEDDDQLSGSRYKHMIHWFKTLPNFSIVLEFL